MNTQNSPDWQSIREGAARFSEGAFQFIREGLSHTAATIHGEDDDGSSVPPADAPGDGRTRHITGQQLCHGLRDLAIARYGLLAGTVLRRWGFRRTEDFGTVVFALIDRGEMRAGPNDSYDDFRNVFDFDDAFSTEIVRKVG